MSSVITAIIGSVIGALGALLLQKRLACTLCDDGSMDVIDQKSGDILVNIPNVNVRLDAFGYQEILFARRTTTQPNTSHETPNFSFKNSQNRDVRIFTLSFVPDAVFRTNGLLRIKVNKVEILPETIAGDFTDLAQFTVPIPENGLLLKNNEKIEIFIGTSSGTSALTLAGLVGEYV